MEHGLTGRKACRRHKLHFMHNRPRIIRCKSYFMRSKPRLAGNPQAAAEAGKLPRAASRLARQETPPPRATPPVVSFSEQSFFPNYPEQLRLAIDMTPALAQWAQSVLPMFARKYEEALEKSRAHASASTSFARFSAEREFALVQALSRGSNDPGNVHGWITPDDWHNIVATATHGQCAPSYPSRSR